MCHYIQHDFKFNKILVNWYQIALEKWKLLFWTKAYNQPFALNLGSIVISLVRSGKWWKYAALKLGWAEAVNRCLRLLFPATQICLTVGAALRRRAIVIKVWHQCGPEFFIIRIVWRWRVRIAVTVIPR